MTIRLLTAEAIQPLVASFNAVGWQKPAALFEQYLHEQECGERLVWVACVEGAVAGYGTLVWKSDYPFFAEQNIPEIKDLNVLPDFRKRGIASALLDEAEKRGFEKSERVGIGVGLYADYGSAQRLYVKRGYIPDGHGIAYDYATVEPGTMICLDDDLVLWFIKELR